MAIVVLLAGGTSTRFGSDKLEYQLDHHTVLEKNIEKFSHHPQISSIVLVGKNFNVPAGETRYQSVKNGIEYCKKKFPLEEKILVHNAANPFVTDEEITAIIDAIEKNCCVGVGKKISGTVRKIFPDTIKNSIPIDRENLYEMQTPQGAMLENFVEWIQCYEAGRGTNSQEITDELCLAENFGAQTKILPASPQNIKITYKNDVETPIYRAPDTQVKHDESAPLQKNIFPVTGFGIDSHRFEEINPTSSQGEVIPPCEEGLGGLVNKPCILCGIEIKNSPAFQANSDGDVAFHAISNAILSALGKNSFSTIADPLCKQGITDSSVYLQKILEILYSEGKKIIHLSLTFEGKKPKTEKYFPQCRINIAKILQISVQNIGLNATTGEGLDDYGKGLGMKVSALVSII